MKIFICGYMGSGKTTTGQILAHNLQFPFLDLDKEIETLEKKSVTQIFKNKGEIYFRKKENDILKKILLKKENLVLSLGGGTPCYGENLKLIKNAPDVKLIYLKSSAENLTDSLFAEKENRPLISHLETKEKLLEYIQKHLFERNFYYNQSDIIISVNEKTPDEISFEIIDKLY